MTDNAMNVKLTYPDGSVQTVNISEEAAKRCGVSFNPSNDHSVDYIKGFCAAAMQAVINIRDEYPKWRKGKEYTEDNKRCFETALTQIESGQMFAVKGVFQ